MKIISLTKDKYDEFIKFNTKIYPTRSDIKGRFEFQVLDNPLLINKSSATFLIVCDDQQRIIGQFGLNQTQYHLGGKISSCFCGFDLFVSEEYRKHGLGSSLIKKSLEEYSPFFPIGVSEQARTLYRHFNELGSANTFIWIRKIRKVLKPGINYLLNNDNTSFNLKVKTTVNYKIPPVIIKSGKVFKLINSLDNWEYSPWRNDVIEFSRSKDFLQWRFFTRKDYLFYLCRERNNQIYFVVKKIFLKGLNILALVDFRITSEEKKDFKSILRCSKFLARVLGCDGVVIMCSHKFFEKILKSSLFIKIGKPQELFTKVDFGFTKDIVKKRESVLLTMVDGDFEFSYW